MTNTKDKTLGVKEIASLLGCCPQTVRRYHAKGTIPTQQIGGKWSSIRASRVDLLNFLKKKQKERR
ncbi:helix-turn-helix domain-containing protein [Agrobacterium tumefaciens]|nr:helix-turn-helix domain-containing protein [Agrobacterium tumefaciens]